MALKFLSSDVSIQWALMEFPWIYRALSTKKTELMLKYLISIQFG